MVKYRHLYISLYIHILVYTQRNTHILTNLISMISNWSMYVCSHIHTYISTCSVTVTFIKNGHGDLSSIPGQDCLHFTKC